MNDTIVINLDCGCHQGLIRNADGTRTLAHIDQDLFTAWCEQCQDDWCAHMTLLADSVLGLDLT